MPPDAEDAIPVAEMAQRITDAHHADSIALLEEIDALETRYDARQMRDLAKQVTGLRAASKTAALRALRDLVRRRQTNLSAGQRVQGSTASG